MIDEELLSSELTWLKKGMADPKSIGLGGLVHFEVLASDVLRLSAITMGEVLLTTRIHMNTAPMMGLSFTAQCADLEKFMRGSKRERLARAHIYEAR